MGINVLKCIQGKQKNQHQKLYHIARSRLKRLQKCFAICPLEKLGVCEKCASGGVC
jgi:hypothetical protein